VIGLINKIIKLLGEKNVKANYVEKLKDLKKRGLKVGDNVIISPSAKIDHNYPYLISIGNNCVIGPGVRLVAHDSTINLINGNYTRVGKIEIKDNCILSLNSIILPGVTIGPNALVASGSVVNKNIPENSCVAGNPARFYSTFDDLIKNMKNDIDTRPKFQAVDLEKKEDLKNRKRKEEIIKATKDGIIFIKGFEARYPIWLENIDLNKKNNNK
jgi:acetyltransferase-like isoleucine patch superfamily enzyme